MRHGKPTPLLGKGGVDATIKKNDAKPPLKGADGVVGSSSDYRWLDRTTPSALSRSHPSFAKEGSL